MTSLTLSHQAVTLAILALKKEEKYLYRWQIVYGHMMTESSRRVPIWEQSPQFLSALKQRDRVKERRAKIVTAVKQLKAQLKVQQQ